MTAQVAEAVLPRVSGRHRDRALASARQSRAIQLKLQGLTELPKIMSTCGLARLHLRRSTA